MNVHHAHERRRRARGTQVVIALILGLLAAAFFRIQVLGSDAWELRATSNRIRQLSLPAPRGIIYDRNGDILVDNVPGYAITLLPGPLDEARETLERMSAYVEMSEERIERVLATLRRYGREVVVDADADFETVSALEERRAADTCSGRRRGTCWGTWERSPPRSWPLHRSPPTFIAKAWWSARMG